MLWVEKIACKNITVLDKEFDEWEYFQQIEQRYTSNYGTYGTYIPIGKSSDEYEKRERP